MRASSWERIPSPPRIGNGKLLNEGQLLINELEAATDGLVGARRHRQVHARQWSMSRFTVLDVRYGAYLPDPRLRRPLDFGKFRREAPVLKCLYVVERPVKPALPLIG